jgi:hypothetical protein
VCSRGDQLLGLADGQLDGFQARLSGRRHRWRCGHLGVFRSESDAVVEVSTAVRVVIEVAVFAAATAALAAVGGTRLAIAFAFVAAINEVLNYALD